MKWRPRIRTHRPLLAVMLTACAVGLSAQRVHAQGSGAAVDPRETARDAIDQVWSPYCPGFMLEVCSSSEGAALRDSIHAFADSGWTTEQLVDWVVANHGEEYRALPRAEGRGLLVWLVPPFALLFGVALVVVVMRRLRPGERREFEPEPEPLSSEDQERLRAALREAEASEEPAF